MLAQAYIPFDARPDAGADDHFDARVSRLRLGDAALVDFACGHGRGRRTRREIAQTPPDLVGILAMRHGSLGLTLNGNSMLAGTRTARGLGWERAGDRSMRSGRSSNTLVVPRARLRAAFPRLDDVVGRVLPADSSPLPHLQPVLETLADRGPVLDDVSRTAAGGAAIELARVALGAGLPSEPQRLREAIVMQVRRYIEMHLQEPGLTRPACGCARSPFGPARQRSSSPANPWGSSFAAAASNGATPDLVHRATSAVSDIPAPLGLRDSSYFSRAFRRHYGVAPPTEECARAGSDCAVAQRVAAAPVSHGYSQRWSSPSAPRWSAARRHVTTESHRVRPIIESIP